MKRVGSDEATVTWEKNFDVEYMLEQAGVRMKRVEGDDMTR